MHPQLPKYVLFIENPYKMTTANVHNDHSASARNAGDYRRTELSNRLVSLLTIPSMPRILPEYLVKVAEAFRA